MRVDYSAPEEHAIYGAPMTFHVNGEDVRLVPVPAAHTVGDTMVHIANANVIMRGEIKGR